MILVCGGAGYIGSHIVALLKEKGYQVLVVDNFSTGHQELAHQCPYIEADIGDERALEKIFNAHPIEAVFHFCASSLVGESVKKPYLYYQNNVANTLLLLQAMQKTNVKKFIFSSTAAVYGEPEKVPISETQKVAPINPYGRSKAMIEAILADAALAYGLRYVTLRYFNAAGAWPEKNIGEWHDPETHLIPLILNACQDTKKSITVFGEDYPTADGTCIRDYIHVKDLAEAHLLALEYLQKGGVSDTFNLGTQDGFSVKQVIDTVREVTKKHPNIIKGDRRIGDPAVLVADASKAQRVLGWQAVHSHLKEIVSDAWAWHNK